ncbi:SPFH domain-containing protein [Maribellus maritimus]|nr:SPFH domain-containing protein [Maribellus maritimus]
MLKYRNIIIIAFFSILLVFNSFFQVEPEEVGVITRFGKYVRKVESGLNMKMPFIERVYKVPVERQQKLEFGFRTVKASVNTQRSHSSLNYLSPDEFGKLINKQKFAA